MTSNVVTLPGKSPPVREVPEFKPSIKGGELDDLKALYTFSHHQYVCQAVNNIAELEGEEAAIRMLLELIADLQKRRALK